jgi:hypothetical protein
MFMLQLAAIFSGLGCVAALSASVVREATIYDRVTAVIFAAIAGVFFVSVAGFLWRW